jgi:enoyl-CoA hydratase
MGGVVTSDSPVLHERQGDTAIVRLSRPEKRNAIDRATVDALHAICAELETSDVRVIVLTAVGDTFASGADIAELRERKRDDALAAINSGLFRRIERLPMPTIAAVRGYALGGGCELAMACDMIVASETAVFGQPEVLIGTMPGAGGTQRLTKKVGSALAMEMCLTGRRLTAREAMSYGLVNRVVPVEAYLSEAKKLAQHVASMSPTAVRSIKAAVRLAVDESLIDGLKAERQAFYATFDTADQKEGMKAFAEKRKPVWTGR